MDMREPYIQATVRGMPGARQKIVFDRCRIMRHRSEAVDKVGRQEQRALKTEGDEPFGGTEHLWLYVEENLPDTHRPTLRGLIGLNLKPGLTWAIKETLRELWE